MLRGTRCLCDISLCSVVWHSGIIPSLTDILVPPVGVFMVTGCGADLLINICLTLLGYIPGHVHGFYVEYQYYKRRDIIRSGGTITKHAAGIYSKKVQSGGGVAVPPA